MSKVKNKKVLRRLAVRKLLGEKGKNVIAVFAVMLTAVLFTAVFTIGNYILKSSQEATMRQVGGSSHAGVKYCLPEDVEKLSQDSAVKQWGTRLFVGSADNEELLKTPSEIGCVDENYAKFSFCEPTEGTLPADYYDCAVSTLVLDAMGLPHELGVKLPLTFRTGEKTFTETFTVCGIFEGDVISGAQMIFISKAWCDENVPKRTMPYDGVGDISGYIQFDFFFDNSFDIEGKVQQLLIRNGYDPAETAYGVNWGYGASSVDFSTILLIVVVLALIIISGYLIIYNIFYIRVSSDIRSYGLLKTIGTTGKQLKKIVHIQAFCLSAAGIPFGLLAGYFLGIKLVPVIVDNFNVGTGTSVTANPWIFIGAGIFTLLTVWISCIRPCRLAAKVSPIEAVRYVENSGMKIKTKSRKSRKVTAFSMAWGNVKRTPKKVVLVVLSMSLSLILLNSAYSIIHGFDMDKFVESGILGDFIVTDATMRNVYSSSKNIMAVNDTVKQDLEASGVAFTREDVYYTGFPYEVDGTAYENTLEFIDGYPEIFNSLYGKPEAEQFMEDHMITVQCYGISDWTLNHLELVEGVIDADKFATGKYCIAGPFSMSEDEEDCMKCYSVGDVVKLECPDGVVREYEVMAVASMKYALSVQWSSLLGIEFILPEQEWLSHFNTEGAMLSVLNLENPSDTEKMEEWISKYTTEDRRDLTYISRKTYEKEFSNLKLMIVIVGGILSFILAMIGILNFINSVVTGILNRQREFAMMEAVGMTGKQLKNMLAWEGMLYAGFTMVFVLTAGMAVCRFIVESFAGQMWFFTWHFEIMPVVVCIPVLAAVSWIIPIIAYQKMLKESVVERLRCQE